MIDTPGLLLRLPPTNTLLLNTINVNSTILHDLSLPSASTLTLSTTSAAFVPLLSFPRLHTLSLRLGFRIALTDVDLTTFASAWPPLRSPKIVGKHSAENSPAPITLVLYEPSPLPLPLPLPTVHDGDDNEDTVLSTSSHPTVLARAHAWTPSSRALDYVATTREEGFGDEQESIRTL